MEQDSSNHTNHSKSAPAIRKERSSQSSFYDVQEIILEQGGGHQRRSRQSADSKVIYLNGEALSRPLTMPENIKKGLIIFLVAAAVIGALIFGWYCDQTFNEPKRRQQAIAQTLAADSPYQLPALSSLISLSNAEILAKFTEEKLPVYEIPPKEGSQLFDIVKLPTGINVAEAGLAYAQGVNKLDAREAARLLNGSWTLQVNRENGVNMVVRYATFKAESVDAAVQTALAEQGLNETEVGESGTDSAGNTFVAGTLQQNDHTYSWRISALPMSKIYNIEGFPQGAVYVGIRMTS